MSVFNGILQRGKNFLRAFSDGSGAGSGVRFRAVLDERAGKAYDKR